MSLVGISKHQYYYKPTGNKSGCRPSDKTLTAKGYVLSSNQLEDKIRHIKKVDNYGYIKTSYQLKQDGLIINKKKVYRIMKALKLLNPKVKRGARTYVTYRKVLPKKPLTVLEMDIKFVWTEALKKHAYVLTVLDTFTRHTLHHIVEHSIKKEDVKKVWAHIIETHFQPMQFPDKPINIEIRNDNDKRFSALTIQEYFKENHLNQVFTHPYTPQENGHIESFHAILGSHLKSKVFWNIEELRQNLVLFYDKYNNGRIHSSIAYLTPRKFWTLWDKNLIDKDEDIKKRRIKFKLKIPYYEVQKHTGNMEPESCSLLNISDPAQAGVLNIESNKKINGTELSHNLRSKISPSAVPCSTNVKHNLVHSSE